MDALVPVESHLDPVIIGILRALHDVEIWVRGEESGFHHVYPNMVFADYEPVLGLIPLESGIGGGWGPYFAFAIGLEERLGIQVSDNEIEALASVTFGQLVMWVRQRLANPVQIVGGRAIPIS